MSAEFEALRVATQAAIEAIGKAVVLIQSTAGAPTPEEITAVTDELNAATAALQAVIEPPPEA